jgi:hypothetical protein
MPVRTVHLIPEPFDRERVLPDEQCPQRPEQNGERLPIDRAIQPLHTPPRADAHVVLRQRNRLRLRLGGVLVRRRAAIRIQVRGLHLVLMIDAAYDLVRPREAQNLHVLDHEVGLPRRIGQRLANPERQRRERGRGG